MLRPIKRGTRTHEIELLMSNEAEIKSRFLPSDDHRERLRRWRMMKDIFTRLGVGIGGVGVIIAITLIFFYLVYVVIPLFQGAKATPIGTYGSPAEGAAETVHLAMEEQGEIAVQFTVNGRAVFFDTHTGAIIDTHRVALPVGATITSFGVADPVAKLVGFGLSNGQAIVITHQYDVTFPNDRRLITPRIMYPFGEEPIVVDMQAQPLTHLAVQTDDVGATIAAATGDGRLVLTAMTKTVHFIDDSVTLSQAHTDLPALDADIRALLMNPEQRNLYVVSMQGRLTHFDIRGNHEPEIVQHVQLIPNDHDIATVQLLSGGISLLVSTTNGTIAQWFSVRGADGKPVLTNIREFHTALTGITQIVPEYFRKGFVASDREGRVGVYHTTAHRTVLVADMAASGIQHLAIGPRANYLLTEDTNQQFDFWELHNEHPEISWSSLWGKVWYESYQEPEYVWQSSAATETFEPKFSLVPISFGTIKAALYAMLFAIVLSILGAIYTAHFMAPKMRSYVKPSIEVMEALPTVILGFLAGLWLAPFIERNLPGVVTMLIVVPLGVVVSAYVWSRLPETMRHTVSEGWEAALLIVPITILAVASIAMSPWLELTFFGGDVRQWLTSEIGISFDQRNSIVVGLAMGFAVIPTIFSISEDAIFAVPKHLTHGSLAMGATPWQTLTRVVILTASPGIFSAVMIGLDALLGRP